MPDQNKGQDIFNDADLDKQLHERFVQLPKALQDAILSSGVEEKLRTLSETHKLHLDQWRSLENEVMFTLLGFEPAEKLAENLEVELGIPSESAVSLAQDVSTSVFDPIRAALELETAEPSVGAPAETPAPAAEPSAPAAQPVQPATPPPPPPEGAAVRAPISSSYQSQQPSHARKSVEGDPYREQLE